MTRVSPEYHAVSEDRGSFSGRSYRLQRGRNTLWFRILLLLLTGSLVAGIGIYPVSANQTFVPVDNSRTEAGVHGPVGFFIPMSITVDNGIGFISYGIRENTTRDPSAAARITVIKEISYNTQTYNDVRIKNPQRLAQHLSGFKTFGDIPLALVKYQNNPLLIGGFAACVTPDKRPEIYFFTYTPDGPFTLHKEYFPRGRQPILDPTDYSRGFDLQIAGLSETQQFPPMVSVFSGNPGPQSTVWVSDMMGDGLHFEVPLEPVYYASQPSIAAASKKDSSIIAFIRPYGGDLWYEKIPAEDTWRGKQSKPVITRENSKALCRNTTRTSIATPGKMGQKQPAAIVCTDQTDVSLKDAGGNLTKMAKYELLLFETEDVTQSDSHEILWEKTPLYSMESENDNDDPFRAIIAYDHDGHPQIVYLQTLRSEAPTPQVFTHIAHWYMVQNAQTREWEWATDISIPPDSRTLSRTGRIQFTLDSKDTAFILVATSSSDPTLFLTIQTRGLHQRYV